MQKMSDDEIILFLAAICGVSVIGMYFGSVVSAIAFGLSGTFCGIKCIGSIGT